MVHEMVRFVQEPENPENPANEKVMESEDSMDFGSAADSEEVQSAECRVQRAVLELYGLMVVI